MKIEEARKTIKELLNSNEPICEYMLKHQEIEAMQKLLNELEKKDKVIDMMAEYIEEWTGSCPNDMYDWQEIDCEKVCDNSMKQCWIEYFYNKIGGNIDKKQTK